MDDREKLRMVETMQRLMDEEKEKCDEYKTCKKCPDMLSDGHCKVRLAMAALRDQLAEQGIEI